MDGLALLDVFIDTPGEFRVDIDAWRAASARAASASSSALSTFLRSFASSLFMSSFLSRSMSTCDWSDPSLADASAAAITARSSCSVRMTSFALNTESRAGWSEAPPGCPELSPPEASCPARLGGLPLLTLAARYLAC